MPTRYSSILATAAAPDRRVGDETAWIKRRELCFEKAHEATDHVGVDQAGLEAADTLS